jgi:hypothetical protein
VDLRHESTHNELPSAASLRLAADQALAWLQLNYWQRQAGHLEGCAGKMRELVQVRWGVGGSAGQGRGWGVSFSRFPVLPLPFCLLAVHGCVWHEVQERVFVG